MRAKRFLTLIAVAILPGTLFARRAPCSSESVLATVTNKQGIPVRGLKEANFRAKFHHRQLKILSVEPWSNPPRVLLLFDVSGSMIDWMRLEMTVGTQIVQRANPQTRFAMTVFTDRIYLSVPFKAGPLSIVNEISTLGSIAEGIPKKERRTAIFDAINASLSMFGEPRPGDLICIITDGRENHGRTSVRQVEHALLANGIRAYAVLLTIPQEARITLPGEVEGREGIAELARKSGGAIYTLQSEGSMFARTYSNRLKKKAFDLCQELDLQLTQAYLIRTCLPGNLRKPETWKLEVINRDGEVDHHVSVVYPSLSPCQTTQ